MCRRKKRTILLNLYLFIPDAIFWGAKKSFCLRRANMIAATTAGFVVPLPLPVGWGEREERFFYETEQEIPPFSIPPYKNRLCCTCTMYKQLDKTKAPIESEDLGILSSSLSLL